MPRRYSEGPNGSVGLQPWLRDAETIDEIFLAYCGSPSKSGESDARSGYVRKGGDGTRQGRGLEGTGLDTISDGGPDRPMSSLIMLK